MQENYSINMAPGRVGQIADSSIRDIESYKNPAGEVKFGRAVTRGAATNEVVHPDATGEVTNEKLIRGVVVATHEMESKADGEDPGYVANSVVPVMRKGRVFVKTEDAVTEGTSSVFVRFAGGDLGAFRTDNDDDGGAQAAEMPKAKWKSSTTEGGQLAVLELDL